MHKGTVYRSSWLVFISAAGVALALVFGWGMPVRPAAAGGGVIPVCITCPHTTLASAVGVAVDGDTILIQEESLQFLEPITITQDITITGIPTSSKLDLEPLDDYVFALYITPTAVVVMQNLVFQGHYGGGIYNEGRLILNEVSFIEFYSDSFGGVGPEPSVIFSNHSLTVTNSDFRFNDLVSGGVIVNEGVAYLENNMFSNNTVPSLTHLRGCHSQFSPGKIIFNDGLMVIKQMGVFKNRNSDALGEPKAAAGAVFCPAAPPATYGIFNRGDLQIADSLFQQNYGLEDSPLIFSFNGSLLLNNSVFDSNENSVNVAVREGTATLQDNIFQEHLGGRAIIINSSQVQLIDNQFLHNYATRYSNIQILSNSLPAQVNIEGCLFSHNTTLPGRKSGSFGGAIFVGQNTQVSIKNCVFEYNRTYSSDVEGDGDGLGGVIYNEGQTQIDNSLFQFNSTDNRGQGGAIYQSNRAGSTLLLTNSVLAYNRSRYGAGIYSAGVITIENSSLTNNYYQLTGSQVGFGGGIFQAGGEIHLLNSTISGNYFSQSTPSAQVVYGGGIYVQSGSSWLTHTTIVNNTGVDEGGGIYQQSGSVTAVSSIVAGNETADCAGSVTSGGYNLFGEDMGCLGNGTTDIEVNPAALFTTVLDSLNFNGNVGQSHLLLVGSPALDMIPAGVNGCGTTITHDQREVGRPAGGACDVGAIEGVGGEFAYLKLNQVGSGRGQIDADLLGFEPCALPSCIYLLAPDTSVALTTTTAPGSHFAEWMGGCTGMTTTCQITVTGRVTVTAVFTLESYPLTVSVVDTETGNSYIETPWGDCFTTCTYQVAYGTSVWLKAMDDYDHFFVEWVGGCAGISEYCVFKMENAQEITAVFERAQYIVQVAITGEGQGTISSTLGVCSSVCEYEVLNGTNVTFTILESTPGSEFVVWEGACRRSETDPICVINDIQYGLSIRARFDPILYQFTMTSTPPAGGDIVSNFSHCQTSCTYYDLVYGEVITMTATPALGYFFSHWNGACTGSDPMCVVTITQTAGAEAVFEPMTVTFPFTVTVSGPAGGSVTSGLGVCEDSCTYEVTQGETITLTAVPTAGITFSHWSGACSSSDQVCVLTVEGAAEVEAVFELLTYPLTVTVSGPAGGSVTSGLGVCEDSCTYEVTQGETITLTAVPTAGITFSHWSGACSGSSLACVLTVEGAAGVEAVFEEIVLPPASHQVYLPLLLR